MMSEYIVFDVFSKKSKKYGIDDRHMFIGSRSTTIAKYSTMQDVSFNLSERKNYKAYKYAVKWIPYQKSSFDCVGEEDIYIVWPIEDSQCRALTLSSTDFKKYYNRSGLQTIPKKSNVAEYDVWLFRKKYIDEFFCEIMLKGVNMPVSIEEIIAPLETRFREGGKTYKFSAVYERNVTLRNKVINNFRRENNGELFCSICGFDFSKTYGEYGSDFIEVHHTIPLSEDDRGEHQAEEKELICVCSNCHRMLHHKKPAITPEELEQYIKEQE